MFAYFALTVLLLVLGYWEAISPIRPRLPIVVATVVLIAFVGLRYETGADWVEYESLLYLTPSFFNATPLYYNPNLVVEPGFSFLLSLVNTLNLSFEALLFIVAVINISILGKFLSTYSRYPVLVLLWYCGFVLLIGQMAAIRQVMAYAFIMLAFIMYDRGRRPMAVLWSAVAISMHVFSIILLPIIFIRAKPPATKIVIVLCSIGLGASLVGINIVALLIAPVSFLLGGIVETKLEFYGHFAAAQISVFALLLAVWHGGVLALINRRQLEEWQQPVVRSAIYAAIWSLVAHTFLATLPAIWNRVMLFSMPLEMIALLRCYAPLMRQPTPRLAISVGIWAVSAAAIGFGLIQENALPYVPYQSLAQVWLTRDIGDGRLRYMIEQERASRLALERQEP